MSTEEWVVYSVRHPSTGERITQAVSRSQWSRWQKTLFGGTLIEYDPKLLAEGLTKVLAEQMAALTKD